MSIIKVEDLAVRYESTYALTDVNFDVKDKEFIGIIGPNGGGKTTLVKALLGLLQPSKGTIYVDDQAVMGYVPQVTTFDKSFPITVLEVIMVGHLPKKFKWLHKFVGHEQEHAVRVMKNLGIEHLADRQIGQLSGGQMQRVLIARALMNHPTILILDEPTASVDESTKDDIYKMLKQLNEDMTILMITHDTAFMWPYLDRCIYINKTAHLHNHIKNTGKDDEEEVLDHCPIEWFIEGEKIQKDLELAKEQKNDRSHI